MRIKAIVSGVAIALAASVGSAFAADPLATLEGIAAVPMGPEELSSVRGGIIIIDSVPADPIVGEVGFVSLAGDGLTALPPSPVVPDITVLVGAGRLR